MVGGALKVSPILEAGVTTTYVSYFPQGNWVNMANFAEILTGG
jgi:alpha-glucosidase (family GH31 glycosyl hydrolase)